MGIRPRVWTDPLRDVQRAPPAGWCRLCGAELYGRERELCPLCRAELTDREKGTRNDVTGVISTIPDRGEDPAAAGAAAGGQEDR